MDSLIFSSIPRTKDQDVSNVLSHSLCLHQRRRHLLQQASEQQGCKYLFDHTDFTKMEMFPVSLTYVTGQAEVLTCLPCLSLGRSRHCPQAPVSARGIQSSHLG